MRQTSAKVTFNDHGLTQRLIDIRTVGLPPLLRGPAPQGLRCRGFPYDQSETECILSKLWKYDGAGRVMIAPKRAIYETDKITCCATKTVRGRLPDRRWRDERRVIWDGRFANLSLRKSDY